NEEPTRPTRGSQTRREWFRILRRRSDNVAKAACLRTEVRKGSGERRWAWPARRLLATTIRREVSSRTPDEICVAAARASDAAVGPDGRHSIALHCAGESALPHDSRRRWTGARERHGDCVDPWQKRVAANVCSFGL